ncbi:MAG: flagellin [Hyphomicrobiales bacterium]
MSEINLSSAVRTSLTSLQATADLLSSTQERLATGNRVNSALDDPTAFFTASALNNRASDLSTLLDAEQQAIRTVEVADDAISAIEDLLSSARAQANAALQTEDPGARATAAAAFDDIISQIELLADDASFNGTNLLEGDDLQVVFNEDGSSRLNVEGFNLTDAATSLGIETQAGAVVAATPASLSLSSLTFTEGQSATIQVGSQAVDVDFTAGAAGPGGALTPAEAETQINDAIAANATLADSATSVASGSITSDFGNITITNNGAAAGTTVDAAGGSTAFAPSTGGDFATDAQINSILSTLDGAFSTLRSTAASLGSDLSTIQIRQDFTSALINTLEAGSGDLTLADLNEEGANLLTLQTRQQLASTSLSFATQADQSVLSLFG